MTPGVPSPAQAPQPETPPQVQIPDTSSNNSTNIVVWFVVGLVIIIIAVGGIYFFLNRQQTAVPQTQTAAPLTSPSPSPQPSLEDDLNSINIPLEADADFSQVDQDLQKL